MSSISIEKYIKSEKRGNNDVDHDIYIINQKILTIKGGVNFLYPLIYASSDAMIIIIRDAVI